MHVAGAVAIPAVQLAARHSVSEEVKPVHALRVAPSHVARAQISTSVLGHALREPWGSPFTATHLPTLPGTSHASHVPEQAESQHTPSMQLPESHSAALLQVVEFFFAHLPLFVPAHVLPAPQSALSQQTPSVQNKPLGHDALVVHDEPVPARGTHLNAVASQ